MNGERTPPAQAALNELTRVFWRQRGQLERLHYHLAVQELILSSGDDGLLRHVVDDVQDTMDAIAGLEAERATLTATIAAGMGLGTDASLQDLIDRAEPPFDDILVEHRDAFLTLVADITTVSLNGRDQLQRGLSLTQDLAGFVVGDAGDGGYDRTGATIRGSAERGLIDREL